MTETAEVTLYVVRHARAGNRERWTDPDHLRPLTKSGKQQAKALIDLFAGDAIRRVISSPFVRSMQTVEPLAAARGLEVETHGSLAEGATLGDTLALLESLDEPTVLCTHGDVLENLMSYLHSEGLVGREEARMKKGSTWVLEVAGDAIKRATYLPPPA